ncbi:uroporphyrinogen-III synthase [Qipengyuania citrea]|uniref:Uroporphyrinogen-III synthase n=1 Tax=Qipengyuania citrea TaxID=225971 RepID=A0ABY4U8N7_9SPHN|nr:uroporphyrinogen-III synthase [Qipengyuania citrea]USA60395.1 uroporphyrinogen-III synthase [Qipengyuania citrea]
MKTLFLFRPEPGWSVSSKTALDMGLDVSGAPLFTVEPVDWEVPDPEQFDGLLVGSANVFRHGGKQIDRLTKLPVHAVGDATADAARNAGFLIGRTGRGGLQSLLDELDGRELHLLRLAGEDRVTLRLPEKIRIETKIVYRAVPQSMTDDDIARLRTGGVVALHSGAAAERLQVEFDRHEMDRSQVDLAVIGPRVAEMAGEGWRSVEIADAPGDSELLALARALCQTNE